MGIRETLNRNPMITSGVTAGIILVALGYILFSSIFSGGGGGGGSGAGAKAFFTVDDGKTWFADSADKIPPFDHEGQQAVRVHVFTCDGGKTKFAAFMERYTPDAAQKLAAVRSGNASGNVDLGAFEMIEITGKEVKKPGAGKWVKMNVTEASRITEIKCPDGTFDNLDIVMP